MKKLKEKIYGLKSILDDYILLEMKNPLPKADDREKSIINNFRDDVKKIQKSNPGPSWRFFSFRMRTYIRFFDPRNFLNWDVIRGTMFQKNIPDLYLREMTSSKEWPLQWVKVTRENSFGNPEISSQINDSSGNLLTHIFHLYRLKEATGISFKGLDKIVEFGGGYGSMCRLIRNLGFKGTYIIFDLPIFLCLQKLYLNNSGYKTEYVEDRAERDKNILVSKKDDLKRLSSGPTNKGNLFIATWSISETPIKERNEIMDMVKNFDYFIIGYQREFDGIDNNRYFDNFAAAHNDVEWTVQDISEWSSRYLIGKRK